MPFHLFLGRVLDNSREKTRERGMEGRREIRLILVDGVRQLRKDTDAQCGIPEEEENLQLTSK